MRTFDCFQSVTQAATGSRTYDLLVTQSPDVAKDSKTLGANCLVPRRLKCGKRKTRLHYPSRSIAQWTVVTFRVEAKDAGKGEREK